MPGDRRRDSDLHAERRDEKRRKARYGMRVSGKGTRLLDRLLRQKSRPGTGKVKGKPAGRRGRA
jgi:hypothetical protein